MKTELNIVTMTKKRNQKYIVKIEINCRTIEEIGKSKTAVLYHLATLNPKFEVSQLRLTASVTPLDSKLFRPDEACEIIRLTLERSLTFNHDWTCTLHNIN